MVIDDVVMLFRGDGCKMTFPHECRRSGLNEGTIRKLRRIAEDDFDDGVRTDA